MINDRDLLLSMIDYLGKADDFVFLWNGRIDKDNYRSYLFTSPVEHIYCLYKDELFDCLSKIEGYLRQGYYLAGFISYEAGLAFENFSNILQNNNFPSLWFGVFRNPIIYDHREKRFCAEDQSMQLSEKCSYEGLSCGISNINNTIDKDTYIHDITLIREAIARGETYQVNYTFKHKFDFSGDSENLFYNLCMKQSASYSAFIRCMNMDILSLSPELFFRRNGDHVIVKPMKGTIERGKNNADDISKANELYNSEKNRAENVMIVDLLRNDIGRISKIGSVHVSRLYEIEKYETLFQMTSTIESDLRNGTGWPDFFKSIFPSGSVTGAPKINTMRIIGGLEKEPRGIYTGSIGYIAPNNTSVFNVAIRTVVLDRTANRGEMGIGSGITYDSDAEAEFEECLLKADFLTATYNDFQLIETILWQNEGYYLLDLHLKRLKESSEYFGFNYDVNKVSKTLDKESLEFKKGVRYRVRLLLYKDGDIAISSARLDNTDLSLKRVCFSEARTSPDNRFLYHKTTSRELYNSEFEKARGKGFFDVLFINTNGEVTEGAITNIFVKNGDMFYTPALKCGLLNGVFRQFLFDTGFPIEEKVLFKEDIIGAEKLYLANSVRGMVEVSLISDGI